MRHWLLSYNVSVRFHFDQRLNRNSIELKMKGSSEEIFEITIELAKVRGQQFFTPGSCFLSPRRAKNDSELKLFVEISSCSIGRKHYYSDNNVIYRVFFLVWHVWHANNLINFWAKIMFLDIFHIYIPFIFCKKNWGRNFKNWKFYSSFCKSANF